MVAVFIRSTNLWPLLIPFAFFGAAFSLGAAALWFLAKRTKISQMETNAGTAVHMETPFATFDVRPEKALDSRLALIPLYPGALPQNPAGAQQVSEVHIRGRAFQEISATYWTPDDQQRVWEFYRQQLPDWPRNLDGAQGRELISHRPDCALLVRVSKGQDRTVIETCIKPAGYPNLK